MQVNLLSAVAAIALAMAPVTAFADDPPTPPPTAGALPAGMPSGMPFGQAPTLDSAHVWVINGTSKQQLIPSKIEVAQTHMDGVGAGSMGSAMAKGAALSAVSMVAGPIGMVASSVFSMFGHHAPKPKYSAVLALGGPQSQTAIPSASTAFECDYSAIPGLDPDAYSPVLVKLTVTKDNWRVVSVSSSSDPSAMTQMMMPGMPNMPQTGSHPSTDLQEQRVAGISLQVLSRGLARITLTQPLAPGEYAVVFRPASADQKDIAPIVLRTAWDFTVAGTPANQ